MSMGIQANGVIKDLPIGSQNLKRVTLKDNRLLILCLPRPLILLNAPTLHSKITMRYIAKYFSNTFPIPLFFQIQTVNGNFSNNGHTLQFDLADPTGDMLTITGATLQDFGDTDANGTSQPYVLTQFHLHWGSDCKQGSEHTINGEKYIVFSGAPFCEIF